MNEEKWIKEEAECLEFPEEEYSSLYHTAFSAFTCKDNIPAWVTFKQAIDEANRIKGNTLLRVVKCGWTYFVI